MAIKQNTLLPVLGAIALLIVGTIMYQQMTSDGSIAAQNTMRQVPQPSALPAERGADSDNASETLATVVASNAELRRDVGEIIERNRRLEEENRRLAGGHRSPAATDTSTTAANVGSETAVDTAGRAADALMGGLNRRSPGAAPGQQIGRVINAAPLVGDMAMGSAEDLPGTVAYKTVTPMGYVAFEDTRNRTQGPPQKRYVRTTANDAVTGAAPSRTGAVAARAAAPADEAYFTIPENATLVGVTAMTSIIGRVPIDGRVTDPMQFKAIVGRENLAANGWELPDDLAGMIVTGVAIGDMALSCSEGKIRSATFVFNDGTIRTVSSRGRSGGGSGASGDLGFISDRHGNPCIMGKFVTNAPAYLTDIVGAKTLGVASQAFADAARLVTQRGDGSTTTQIMDTDRYVMGQAVSGATDEFTTWLLSRLKNSFDAVVTPAGHELVVHLDQELQIDKTVGARRIAHRTQTSPNTARGGFYGLE